MHELESKCSFENSNKFIIKLAGLLSARNDKNLLKRINIFTTNYDMYFELSLETNRIYYNDGFSGRLVPEFSTDNYNRIVKQIVQNTERESQIPTINLYKLHGSLAWEKDSGNIKYRSNLIEVLKEIEKCSDVFNCKSFMYNKLSTTNIREPIKQINENNTKFGPKLIEKVNKFNDAYEKLHIVNPTKKKFEETLFSNIYNDLLRMYSNELEKSNSVLFVFGFSFKDEHIYNITKRALANPTMIMYIFVHNKESLDDFKNLFKDHNNVNYVYCENKNINLCEFVGISTKVKVYEEKNTTRLLYNGMMIKNIAVGNYIKILKGYTEIIAVIEGEYIKEIKNVDSYRKHSDTYTRILDAKILGYFDEDKAYVKGIYETPMISNYTYVLKEDEVQKIFCFTKNDEPVIKIGDITGYEDYKLAISVQRLFASHIGIFGNTGSGKSNTLAKLYTELFSTNLNYKKSNFLIIDFNDEYISNDVLTDDKKVYKLDTRKDDGDNFPLPRSVIPSVVG